MSRICSKEMKCCMFEKPRGMMTMIIKWRKDNYHLISILYFTWSLDDEEMLISHSLSKWRRKKKKKEKKDICSIARIFFYTSKILIRNLLSISRQAILSSLRRFPIPDRNTMVELIFEKKEKKEIRILSLIFSHFQWCMKCSLSSIHVLVHKRFHRSSFCEVIRMKIVYDSNDNKG